MKIRNQTIRQAAAILALATSLVPAKIQSAEIPVPAFYVKGNTITAGGVPAAVPAGDEGLIEGTVTSDGESIVFDGTGGRVTFAFDAQRLFGNPFTISAMVETTTSMGYGEILQSLPPAGFGLRTVEHGHFSVSGGKAGAWNVVTSASKSLRLGTFQHVAVTCDGQAVVIYIDGLERGRGELEGVPRADQKIVLGGMGRENLKDGGLVDVPHSRLAHIAIFDSVLTPEQIQALAEGGEIPVK